MPGSREENIDKTPRERRSTIKLRRTRLDWGDSRKELNMEKRISTRTLTGVAIFTAIVVVLQFLGSFIRFGPFSISLVLVPIVVGAALYGHGAGRLAGLCVRHGGPPLRRRGSLPGGQSPGHDHHRPAQGHAGRLSAPVWFSRLWRRSTSGSPSSWPRWLPGRQHRHLPARLPAVLHAHHHRMGCTERASPARQNI